MIQTRALWRSPAWDFCFSLARCWVAEVDTVLVGLQGEGVNHQRILLPVAEVVLRESLLGREALARW